MAHANVQRFPHGIDPAMNTAFDTHRLAGRMMIPEQLTTERQVREWVRQVLQIEAVIAGPPTDAARYDANRAGGECVCDQCGMIYLYHPAWPWEPSLTLLCDGTRYKL